MSESCRVCDWHREPVTTLAEFPQYVADVENIQRLEMDKIQRLAAEEISRQNRLANKTKMACEDQLTQLQNQFENVKQQAFGTVVVKVLQLVTVKLCWKGHLIGSS